MASLRSTFLVSIVPPLVVSLCAAQATKISAPLSFPSGQHGGPVEESALTPDGVRVVYRAGQDFSDVPELYVARTDGSQPVQKLSGTTATTPLNAVLGFQLDHDGTRAVYHLGGGGLYSVRVDGSAAPIGLGSASVYAITPDDTHVVSLQTNGFALDVRNIDGSGTPLILTTGNVDTLALTPDGSRVVYLQTFSVFVGQTQFFPRRLFSVPIDGSTAAVQLSASGPPNGSVASFRLAASGTHVVYRGDQEVVARDELYSVPVAGGTPVRLNAALFTNGDVTQFDLNASADRAVYVASQERSLPDLYSVPIHGGTPARLDPPLGTSGEVSGIGQAFRISPNGRRVLFSVRPAPGATRALYLANVDGSGNARRLDAALVGPFAWSLDNRLAVYQGNETPGTVELFAQLLAGRGLRSASLSARPSPRIRLNAPLVAGGDVLTFQVARDGRHVIYRADQDALDVNELYSVPIDGSAPAVKLSAPLVAGGDVVSQPPPMTDANTVLYYADGQSDEVVELFAVPIAGGPATKLNGALDPGPPYTDVKEVRSTPDGLHAVYQEVGQLSTQDLHVVDLTTHAVTSVGMPVVGDIQTSSMRVSPDGTRIAFLTGTDLNPPPDILCSTPLDGSQPPVVLSPPLGDATRLPHWAFSPDSAYLAFHAYSTSPASVVVSELYAVPADGSAPAVLLDDELHAILLMHPDGLHVAYHAGAQRDLYLARLDGSLSPVQLVDSSVAHGPSQFATLPFQAQFNLDGRRIVFCDDLAATHYDLYSVATAGGAAPLLLSGTLVTGGNVQRFELSADGTRAVYLADADVDGRTELYSVPIDGSSAPVVLSRRPSTLSVRQFVLSPDGSRVAFDQGALCVAPSDGSAPPAVTSVGLSTSSALGFSPDGAWIVVHGNDTLRSVPADGSSSGVVLNGTLDSLQNDAPKFLISADSQWVVYRSTPLDSYFVQLFASALDGASAPVRIDAPAVERGSVGGSAPHLSYVLTPDGRALYTADHDRSAVIELFESALP